MEELLVVREWVEMLGPEKAVSRMVQLGLGDESVCRDLVARAQKLSYVSPSKAVAS